MKFKKLLAGVLSAAMVATMIPSSLAGIFVSAEGLDDHLLFQYESSLTDASGNGNDGVAQGAGVQENVEYQDRNAVYLSSTSHGGGSIQLPDDLTADLSSETGFTFATWINAATDADWTRILDLGTDASGADPDTVKDYFFIAQNGRVVAGQGDTEFYLSDTGISPAVNEWHHMAFTFMPEVNAEGESGQNVGVIVYVDGEVAFDASVNQTNSGTRNALIAWCNEVLPTLTDNYIGYSRFAVDPELNAYLSDMRFYDIGLTSDEVVQVMADGMTVDQVLSMAYDNLTLSQTATSTDISLPSSALAGLVNVTWSSSNPDVMGDDGTIGTVEENTNVTMTATLSYQDQTITKEFVITVYSADTVPYVLNIDGEDVVMDVSDTLFGLFYEDINNAADGGIYAELVQNRSFEFFTFSGYDSNYTTGASSRTHVPLQYWTGDTSMMTAKHEGGLDETNPALTLTAAEDEAFAGINTTVNTYYVTVADGAVISNQGYTSSGSSAMNMEPGATYDFSIYAKNAGSSIQVYVEDDSGNRLTDTQTITVDSDDWTKYETVLSSSTEADTLGTLVLEFTGTTDIDMVSLMPVETWGYTDQEGSETATSNYASNDNYRLREDLMQALLDTNPSFLRFPGGCISEGSYTWDNVYDWKKSIGTAEQREENYNVWGYAMTMGLGYLEYFQMAEDLGAEPLPVMACGVLCQARSDGAYAAGGALMDYYIQSFKDLIEFANGDESTEYGALRAALGHPEPFNLKYLGVGNENWGNEFFANFEVFYAEIMAFCEENGYDITIISTTGAQANDSSYQSGWEFLAGEKADGDYSDTVTTGMDTVVGESGSTATRTHNWYTSDSETDLALKDNYMDTIADEHYYRSNEYLLNNTDRYDYYERVYNEDGTINDELSSKVFVGEYASTDKNTMMGALSEAAIMTSYEQNSDVVRLAATAPLFNKERDDSLYRWTPDVIWFDNDSVWFTPTYYVQSLFPSNLGDELLRTDFQYLDESGEMKTLQPEGGVMLASGNAAVTIRSATIYNADGDVYQTYDFTQMSESDLALAGWTELPSSTAGYTLTSEGLNLAAQTAGYNGIYLNADDMPANYKVVVDATRTSDGPDGFYVGVGVTDVTVGSEDMVVYSINYGGNATGFKVYKDGVEGYTLGDYSVGTAAGNTYLTQYEAITTGTAYEITVDYGTTTATPDGIEVASGRQQLNAWYTSEGFESQKLNANLTAVNDMIYNSVTKDDEYVYIKLVNVDGYSKTAGINIDNLAMSGKGTMTVLAGTEDNVNTANVNTDGNEVIAPVESEITLQNGSTTLTLPAYSLTVLKLEISDGNLDLTMGGSLVDSNDLTTEAGREGWSGYTASDMGATYTEGNDTITEDENGVTFTEAGLNSYSLANPLKGQVTDGFTVTVDATIPEGQELTDYEGFFGFNNHTTWQYWQASNNGTTLQANSDLAYTNWTGEAPGDNPFYYGIVGSDQDAMRDVQYTISVDETGASIYLNGELVATYTEENSDYVSAVTLGAANGLDWFNLGFNAGSGEWNWFNTLMTVSSVSFYNRALTAEEAAALAAYIPSTGVSIDGEDTVTITRGDSVTLNATVYPVGEGEPDPETGKLPGAATNSVTWSSSNPEIATVSKTGTVRGVAAGQATITATTTEGYTDSVTVTVEPVRVSGITINTAAQTIDLGASLRISATVSPSNADNKTLSYQSSNPDVATINEEGILTTVDEGTTTITVSSTDGSNVSATVDITVENFPLESVVVTNAPDFELVVGSSLRLRTDVTPAEAYVTMSYSSDNTEVATVEGGMLSIVGVGNANITVTATKADGSSVSTGFAVTAVEQGALVADYQFNGNLTNDANKLQEGSYQTTTQPDLAVDPETGTITFDWSLGAGSHNIVRMDNPLKGKDLSEVGFSVAVMMDPTQLNDWEGIWSFSDGSGFFGMGGTGKLWYNDWNGVYYDFNETIGAISQNEGMELITVTVDPVNDKVYVYKDATLTYTVNVPNAASGENYADLICSYVSGLNYFNLGAAAPGSWGTSAFTCDYIQVYQRQLTDAEVGYLASTGSIEEPEGIDTTALTTTVTQAALIDGEGYTQSSWDAFIDALTAAKNVLLNPESNSAVMEANTNLTNAMNGLTEYAPPTTPVADVEYTFDGTLESATEGVDAAVLVGKGEGGVVGDVLEDQTAQFSDGSIVLNPTNGYGVLLDVDTSTITNNTFTVSFDVTYQSITANLATLFIGAQDQTSQLWYSIGNGYAPNGVEEANYMIWHNNNGTYGQLNSGVVIETGVKGTITAVFEGTNAVLYLNGEEIHRGTVPAVVGENTNFYLGVNAWDAIADVTIDNFEFYNEALNADQVDYIVNGTDIVYEETPADITYVTGEELTAVQETVARAIETAENWTGSEDDARYQLLTTLNGMVAEGDVTKITAEQAAALQVALNTTMNSMSVVGDKNGDGVLDVLDVMTLAQYVVGSITEIDDPDVNNDGEVDVLDVMYLAQVVNGSLEYPLGAM